MTGTGPAGEQRAWAWMAHLRGGGTTPWAAWSATAASHGRVLPGAQQLELLRRVNLAAERRGSRPSARLAERVLAGSAPGRGRPDLELVGAAEPTGFGWAPVDPADLPPGELLRVAALLLAEDVVTAGPAPLPETGWVRPWRLRLRVAGEPRLVLSARRHLAALGRPAVTGRGRAGRVLVLGRDLPTMIRETYTDRALREAVPTWEQHVRGLARRDALPPRVDLGRAAARWARTTGRSRVVIATDPRAAAATAGVRGSLPVPPPLAADAVELARRVSAALAHLVLPSERPALLDGVLRPWLEPMPGAPLVLPAAQADWVAERAASLRADLARAGYAVAGDLAVLTGRPDAAGALPDPAAALDLALGLLLERDAVAAHPSGPERKETP